MLRKGLATQEDPGWRTSIEGFPLLGAPPVYYDPNVWKRDLDRIRTFYKSKGYFDIKILNEVIRKDVKNNLVSISISIKEGRPVKISNVGLEGIPEKYREKIEEKISLKKGDIFVQSEYLQSKTELFDQLRDRSYAFASVRGRVFVSPKTHTANVLLYVDPGPSAVFGEIEILGLKNIDMQRVRDVIAFKENDVFDPKKIEETRNAIYELGVFSLVKLTPIIEKKETPTEKPKEEEDEIVDDFFGDVIDTAQENADERIAIDPKVPIVINISEAKLWTVRAGAGAAMERSRQDIHLKFNWGSRNFLGGLRRLDHFNTFGYAWAPSIFETAGEAHNNGFIMNSELRFTQPRFLERKTNLEVKLALVREIDPGFSILSPSVKIGVRRKFFDHLTVDLSYNLALFILSDINQSLQTESLKLQSQNVLEYFEQRFLLDYRDQILNPTKGFSITLSFQESDDYLGYISPLIGGDFDYLKPSLDVEAYVPFFDRRIVLALRTNASTIYNINRDKRPPITQTLYGGGIGSIRAFGRRELSPYSFEGEPIPIGGLTRVGGSIEPRFRLQENFLDFGDIWFAPFFDATTVLGGSYEFEFVDDSDFVPPPISTADIFTSMIFGIGVGAWWLTPIGPLRLDFAYRLTPIQNDKRFRRCADQPKLDGTCENDNFVPVGEDEIQNLLSRFNFLLGIGHSF